MAFRLSRDSSLRGRVIECPIMSVRYHQGSSGSPLQAAHSEEHSTIRRGRKSGRSCHKSWSRKIEDDKNHLPNRALRCPRIARSVPSLDAILGLAAHKSNACSLLLWKGGTGSRVRRGDESSVDDFAVLCQRVGREEFVCFVCRPFETIYTANHSPLLVARLRRSRTLFPVTEYKIYVGTGCPPTWLLYQRGGAIIRKG